MILQFLQVIMLLITEYSDGAEIIVQGLYPVIIEHSYDFIKVSIYDLFSDILLHLRWNPYPLY